MTLCEPGATHVAGEEARMEGGFLAVRGGAVRVTRMLKARNKILLSLQISNLRWEGLKKKKKKNPPGFPDLSQIPPLWSLLDLAPRSSHQLFCSHLLGWQLPCKTEHVPSARTKPLPGTGCPKRQRPKQTLQIERMCTRSAITLEERRSFQPLFSTLELQSPQACSTQPCQ